MKKLQHLIDVKRALAEKYDRQAKQTKSTPKRKQLENRATQYRFQISQLEQQARA